jgi:hypothetical protein
MAGQSAVPLALEPGRAAEAEGLLLRARQIARERRARAFELRIATSLGRLYAEQGRVEEARSAVVDILGWFAEGFDCRDLREATELVGRVDAPSGPRLRVAEK